MTFHLKNKTVLITGASRGIGKAVALEMASLGANIVVNYVRNEEAAKQTVGEILKLGVPALPFQANVGDPKALDELIQASLKEFGQIDVVVHSAALGAFKPVHQMKMNHWELSLDVNAKAFFLLAQKVLPSMEKAGGGVMIAISSLGSHRFIPDYGAIGISKAALESLVRYLAVELAQKKIRVNCVSGGLIDTDAPKFSPRYEEIKKEVLKKTPGGRIGKPEDIAKVVKFLVSQDSEWICGQTLVADGGFSLI